MRINNENVKVEYENVRTLIDEEKQWVKHMILEIHKHLKYGVTSGFNMFYRLEVVYSIIEDKYVVRERGLTND